MLQKEDRTVYGSQNGHEPPQDRELYVVLSDRLSIITLAVTWVLLLLAVLFENRRYRRLKQRLAALTR